MKKDQKRRILEEAGGKCANPGCSNWRSHIHHIKHWSIYKAHDSNHMIAVCPSCHDHIHNGIGMSDQLLYEWKKILRAHQSPIAGHIYVEQSAETRVLTGSMCLTSSNPEGAVFRLSNGNNFSFKITGDGDILLTNCSIKDLSGSYLLRIFDGHFKVKTDKAIRIDYRPGRICLTSLDAGRYLPVWTINAVRNSIPDFVYGDTTKIFELEVVRPGVVRLQGVFVADDAVFAITEDKIYILRPELNGAVAVVGGGEETEIQLSGPITPAAFEL